MSVVVLSVIMEVQRMQLKLSSWSLIRLRPLHFTCMQAAHGLYQITHPRRWLLLVRHYIRTYMKRNGIASLTKKFRNNLSKNFLKTFFYQRTESGCRLCRTLNEKERYGQINKRI